MIIADNPMRPPSHTPTALRTPRTPLYQRVKEAVPLGDLIERLQLRRRGRSLQCPNAGAHRHGDATMSAWISASGWSWRCYGCEAGGTVIDLLMLAEGLSRHEAALELAARAGIPVSQLERTGVVVRGGARPTPQSAPPPDPPPTPAAEAVHTFLRESQARLAADRVPLYYLSKRGIPLAVASATGLGFAPRGSWPNRRGAGQPRIIAPLTTPDGTLLTLYGRATVTCDKSLRHDVLPGAKGVFNAPALASDRVVLVEGVFDALACLAGGHQAAALCGLNTRDGWWTAMGAKTVILALDADESGQRRWEALAKYAVDAGKRVMHLKPEQLEGHKDLNEYWAQTGRLPAALRTTIGPHHAARDNGAPG